jgi:predicted dienelactone hydrolase
MSYDPFVRGAAPVGVRTIELRDDPAAPRLVPVEIWYPAIAAYAGADLDDARRDRFTVTSVFPEAVQSAVRDAEPLRGEFPLFLYCHGAYGYRRESTKLCTHLASHGYVVVAPDFPGDNISDVAGVTAFRTIDESAQKRPRQASFVLDQLLVSAGVPGVRIDAARIGTGGISMGGGRYLSGEFPDPEFPAFAIAAAMGPFAELCTEEDAALTARSLCLAHMDATVNDNPDAGE